MTRSIALAITVAVLAGCSGLPTSLQATVTASADPNGFLFGPTSGAAQGGGQMPGGGMGMGGPLMGLTTAISALTLTDDQKTKLAAIQAQYAGAGQPGGTPPSAGADLAALLTATTLDVTALRAALAAQAGAMPGGADLAAELKAYRDVLTADQRTALAAALQNAGPGGLPPSGAPAGAGAPGGAPPTGAMPGGMGGPGGGLPASPDASLALTSTQLAAYTALQAKLSAQPGGGVSSAAIASYMTSGDASALTTSYPIDELLALATSLSVTQRQQLFAGGAPGLMGGMSGQQPAPMAS